MGAVVLDASTLIGFRITSDAHHADAKAAIDRHLQQGGEFLVPATVLSEALVAEARRRPADVESTRRLLTTAFGPVRPVDEDIAIEAARLRAKHASLKLPDALVIATGVVDDAESILTADKRLAKVDKRVTVL